MTKKDIIARALELYPKQIYYNDNEHLFPLDVNEEARKAYVRGVMDIMTGENAWRLLQASKKVNTELYGEETTTKYYGDRMIAEADLKFGE